VSYTEDEQRVLLAGVAGGQERDEVWAALPHAIHALHDRGLIRMGEEVMDNGIVSSFPLCLNPVGVLEARRLQEVDQSTSGP
jgi:hypothetical protein